MDVLQLIIGFIIGLVVGVILMIIIAKTKSGSRTSAQSSQADLKALLAAQARIHLDTSNAVLNEIEGKTQQLKQQLQSYEDSLANNDVQEDDSKATFFGEHASVYLRNSIKSDKKDTPLVDSEAQPRDFSGNSSGLFVGNAAASEKIDK